MGRSTLRVALMLTLVLALPLIMRYNTLTGMVDRGALGKGLRGGRTMQSLAIEDGEATLTYFIAANFFNSADVLSGFVPELKRLLEALGPQRCYVSIWENGSSDGTKGILRALKRDLDNMGVGNSVNTSEVSFVDLCVEAGLGECSEETFKNGVRHTVASTRIQMMALFRNKPLVPLYKHLGENGAGMVQELYPELYRQEGGKTKSPKDNGYLFQRYLVLAYRRCPTRQHQENGLRLGLCRRLSPVRPAL